MKPQIDRRKFLHFAGGSALGLTSSGAALQGLSELSAALESEEVAVPHGPESWAVSLCSLCPANCGLRVRKIGERAVSIRGNPFHPVNRGSLCPRGVAGLQALYHPDRLRTPVRNIGSRKSPKWREVSWKEALDDISARLRRLREAGQAHTVVLIDRRDSGLLGQMLERFVHALGSPNYLVMPSGLDSLQTALYLQQGVTQPVAYDLPATQYLLSFGVNVLEGWGAPVAAMRAFGRWRDSAGGRRTKFVQIEPRFSLTAARADEWVALRPGTEASLALGIAYVLITEGLFNADFVRDHTFGFEDWTDGLGKRHLGFRSLVLSEYRLNKVSQVTDVPSRTILRLAREFAQNRPAVAIGDHQTSTLPGNPYAAMAVHSLNALVGSLEVPGGVLLQTELPLTEEPVSATANNSAYPRIDQTPEYPFPGHHLYRLPQAILSHRPYPVQALILHDVDPVFSLPNGEAFRQAFQEVPFIVSLASFPDETSSLADYVLPIPTDLEKWQGAFSPPTFPQAMVSISPPAVPVRHSSRHPSEVIFQIAQSLGEDTAKAVPFSSFEDYLRHHADDLFASQVGSVFTGTLEETWNRLLERSGWWAPTYSNPDELWQQMKQQGGWWEPTYYFGEWNRIFRTPSSRFEFFSQTLAGWAAKHPSFCRNVGLEPDDDRLFLPHQPPLVEPSEEYPLLLIPIEVLPLAGGNGAHLPFLQQIAGPHLFAHWDSWLEIHPETAHKLGITDGERVWIESRRGRAQVRARLYVGARRGAVHLPVGYGHAAGSAWGQCGVNPFGLIEERYDPVAGMPQTADSYVKVYKS